MTQVTYPVPTSFRGGASLSSPSTKGYIKPTKIKLGSVYLDVNSFTWALVPGPAAFACLLDVFPQTHEKLQRLGRGPHKLEVVATSGVSGPERLIVEKVYLREPNPTDAARTAWRIADRRQWLDFAKYTGFHNLRRKVNDVEGLDPQTFFGYNKEGYRPYSAFAAIDKNGQETLQPWTALGLIRAILDNSDRDGIAADSFSRVEDNGVPVEGVIAYEERPTMMLIELLRLAEVSFFVTLDGKYKFFDRTKDTFELAVMREKGNAHGRIIVQENHRTRPSELHIRFREERETECEFIETAAPGVPLTSEAARTVYEKIAKQAGIKVVQLGGRPDGDRNAPSGIGPAAAGFVAAPQPGAGAAKKIPAIGEVVQLENVVQLPLDLKLDLPGIGAVTYNRGEWVRLDLALLAWEFLDRASGVQPLLYLTLANLQRYWFGNVIGRVYSFNPAFPTWVDPIRVDRVNAVRAAYRRIFRIARPWLDNIHAWDVRRVTIVDPVTRTRALPFVTTQYCEVPNARPPVLAPKQVRVVAVNVDDYTTGKQSPFIVNQQDADLGILTVEPMRDLTEVVRERIRGQVNNIPRYDLNPDGSILWQSAQLQPEFKLKILLTIEWGAPNDKNRLYLVSKTVPVKPGQSRGEAGVLEIGSTLDTARIDKDGNVTNADLLQKIAEYETRQTVFSHRDLGIGFLQFVGMRTHLEPEGFARSVNFVIENGFAYTMYDLTEPYTSRPPQAMMDPSLRKFVYRVTEVL